ncbi:hypothetical protein BJX76DRAFT_325131 [Aspergillus varians]
MSFQAVPLGPSWDPPPGPGVFTQEQIRCLEDAAVLLPQAQPQIPHTNGKRKVSAAFGLTRSVSSSSSSSASVTTNGFQPDVIQTFDIPMAEESVEVLECVGFVADTARFLYNRYLNRPSPDQNPDDLMAYVFGHVALLKSPQYDDMNHRDALRQIGFTVEIQEAITDPRFSQVFGTQSLHHWARDTVETNYAALLGRQRILKSYANQQMTQTKDHKRSKKEASSPQEQGPTQQQAVTATINMTPSDFQFPEMHVVMQTDADILDNHLSLYKGKAYRDLFSEFVPIINDDGTVDLGAIATQPGGDFNWNFAAQYWSPEKETAEEYRKWAARRSPTADTCIIHIQIPLSFINCLHMENLWYSPNWKEYIWTCRRRRRPNPKFDKLWEQGQADVVRGHLCSTISRHVIRSPKESVQTQLTRENVMRLPSGRKASQWMFLQNNTIDRLAQEIRGKIHFFIVEGTSQG